MAHELTSQDHLALAGSPAWHGIGTVLPEAPTVGEALRVARLDWTVRQVPLILADRADGIDADGNPCEVLTPQRDAQGAPRPVSHVANVRSDTGAVLGVVGEGYVPVQNEDLGGLVIDAAASMDVRIESAGSMRGGREVFMLARMGTFEALPGDPVHSYALFHNGHDGTASLSVAPTDVRVVCANTRRLALGRADRAGLRIRFRHTGGIADGIEAIRATLGGARDYLERSHEEARALAARRMTDPEVRSYFLATYDAMIGLPQDPGANAGREAGKRFERSRKRFEATVGAWLHTFESERAELGTDPSAWIAANAVTRWIDHERKGRGDRVYRNLFGSGDALKRTAFEHAHALIGA